MCIRVYNAQTWRLRDPSNSFESRDVFTRYATFPEAREKPYRSTHIAKILVCPETLSIKSKLNTVWALYIIINTVTIYPPNPVN
jgi:hypothetical protein